MEFGGALTANKSHVHPVSWKLNQIQLLPFYSQLFGNEERDSLRRSPVGHQFVYSTGRTSLVIFNLFTEKA